MALTGLFKEESRAPIPFIALERFLDLSALDAIHEEVCLALTQVTVDYTGGSHRSMGIQPPSQIDLRYPDYGEVIRDLSDADYATFRSLADDPSSVPETRDDSTEFGEERDHPLSRRQMLWLKFRHRVYFPWKAMLVVSVSGKGSRPSTTLCGAPL